MGYSGDYKVIIGLVPTKAFKIRNHFQSDPLRHRNYANRSVFATGKVLAAQHYDKYDPPLSGYGPPV